MKRFMVLALVPLLSGLSWADAESVALSARIAPVIDDYFGTTVPDPYRYMESVSSPEVENWAKTQAAITRQQLDAIPARQQLLKRLVELDASVQARIASVQRLPGDTYFYEMRGADDNQFKLYMRRGLNGQQKLLVDPEVMSKSTGKPYAIEYFQPSTAGKFVAYGLSEGGSEEATIHVIDTSSGKEVIKPIDRAHYSYISWLPNDRGFFYLRQRKLEKDMPATEKYRFQYVYLHLMSGNQSDLEIVQAGHSKNFAINAEEFPSIQFELGTKYVTATVQNGVENEFALHITNAHQALKQGTHWRKLFGKESDVTGYAIHGNDLFVLTHKDSPRFKVLRTSLAHPDLVHAEVIIPSGKAVVTSIAAAKNALYILTKDGMTGKVYELEYKRGAKPVEVTLPREGALSIAASDRRVNGILLSQDSWVRDTTIYSVHEQGQGIADTGLQPLGPFGAPDLISKEVMVKSHDGVEVPLSIVMPAGLTLDRKNPVHMWGYGAYGISEDPFYIPRYLGWYELGGIRATCHVRGGGEYGEEWHLAGKMGTKPNTWKDLIACAEYLIQEGYTSTQKLAIHGGSAGGILIGRAMTERPDLFGVAIPEVGVLNALRTETTANGVPNIPEFGSFKDEKQFPSLLEMDAYQHVKDGTAYPATLLVHGMNDPRVDVWQSLKMGARLQAANTSGKPIMLRIDFDAGHGIGSTKIQRQEQYADIWSFMLWQFGDPRFAPKH
jgi:prolyl oligopeptidase